MIFNTAPKFEVLFSSATSVTLQERKDQCRFYDFKTYDGALPIGVRFPLK